MKIIVIGSGAMGCLFGGLLSRNKTNQVILVDTWAEHVGKLNVDGLQIRREKGVERIPVKAVLPSDLDEQADLVIVFTKSQDTESALEKVKHIFKPDSLALTLQNGLGNAEKLTAYLPLNRIIIGTTTLPCDFPEAGVIQTEGEGETRILSADAVKRVETESIAELLTEAELNCSVVDDIYVTIWEKVAFNAALNALCAITRLPVGGVGDVEEGYRLAMTVVEEVISVAHQKGIEASLTRCKETVVMAFAGHKSHQPSMLQDIIAKRPTEIGAINAAVAKEAKQLGLEVPVTAALADLVTIIQKNFNK